MRSRSELTAKELLREVGSVLRMSEADAARLGDLPDDPDEDQTMIINMGPQHPSTHGVLRLMLELQGETVLRCKPIIGYLHTGMETILILEGTQSDERGCHRAGTLLINPEGSAHKVWSDDGCVVLIQWTRPVQFLPEDSSP